MCKRVISVLVCVLLAATGLCACNGEATQKESDKLSVVATIFPAYDFVRQIAGDKVDLKLLMKPGGEVHSYSPTADDMLLISGCDLFISVGGESDEEWVSDTLEASGNSSLVLLKMMDCVETVKEASDNVLQTDEEHHDEEHSEEEHEEEEHSDEEHEEEHDHEDEYDEHVWTSPKNAGKIAADITDKLCVLDAENAQIYRDNADKYIKELGLLDAEFRQIFATAQYKTLIFADRFPFRYFCEEYGFDYFAAFSGCSASADPSAETISALINKVKELGVTSVFTIEFSTGAVADTVIEATGAARAQLHSCHNVSLEDFEGNVTYVELMQKNAEVLKEALNCNVAD